MEIKRGRKKGREQENKVKERMGERTGGNGLKGKGTAIEDIGR